MTLETVRDYLQEQRDEFLETGKQAAIDFRDDGGDPQWGDEERFVAEGWVEYFEELILEMQSLRFLDKDSLREALQAEVAALTPIIDKFDDAIEAGFNRFNPYSFEGEFLLNQMKALLQIEKDSTQIMLDEIDN